MYDENSKHQLACSTCAFCGMLLVCESRRAFFDVQALLLSDKFHINWMNSQCLHLAGKCAQCPLYGCRHNPHLKFMRFFAFVGHGQTKKKRVPKSLISDPSATQMSGAKQQLTLREFGKVGHHVLVSTSIGEEGINIPTCEFVVRYTPTVSGTVRVQSRGRSRVEGGQYLNIVEPESDEHRLLLKSVMEEQQMKKVLKILPQTLELHPSDA